MDIKHAQWFMRASGTKLTRPIHKEGSIIMMVHELLGDLAKVSHQGLAGVKEITVELRSEPFKSVSDEDDRVKKLASEVTQSLLDDPVIAEESKAHHPQSDEDEQSYRARLRDDLKMNQTEIDFWVNDFFNESGNAEYYAFWHDKLIIRLMALNSRFPPADEFPTELSDLKKYARQRYPQMFMTIRFVR